MESFQIEITKERFIELMLESSWELILGYHSPTEEHPTYGFKAGMWLWRLRISKQV